MLQSLSPEIVKGIAEVFGFIGGAIGVSQGIPQFLRILKIGHTRGLELSPWLVMCLSYACWVTYGIIAKSPSIAITNALGFITAALVVIKFPGRKIWSYLILLGLALAAWAFISYSPSVVVTPVLLALTASRLPQLIRSWVNRKNNQLSAVSLSSINLTSLSFVFWMTFAVLMNDPLVIANSCIGLSINLATGILEARNNKRARDN
jgi:uncharacterized protein with PQ loop repeat